ncbi:AP2/B3-like transcriptional factor family protein, putative isoform 2 [Hibiscus syriacus]|uniref:AP2/B3-like transcriptional factor family protein, putative isoform 2 n=1 Tax=Hibiscus syriacus TaxID=106335 RepID=A0A6A3AHW6_HIBSY|nr:AP2/B3-like transcriptional factor family protein, putative isoform 2 [Hibiscus syriacus]
MIVKGKLPETVTLKGQSGGVIWDVGLTEDDGTLFFNDGWKTFVEHQSLIENDFLIFRYNGVSRFDVLMFDGESLCEKASSYFVRKCMHSESECGHQTKRKFSENPQEIVNNSSQCGLESSLEKSTNNDINTRQSTKAIESVAGNKRKKIRNLDSGTRGLGGKELSTFPCKVKVERLETGRSTLKTYSEHIMSMNMRQWMMMSLVWHATGKRVATRAEKMNALLKVQEALTDEGFMVVVKPTHVDIKFYMLDDDLKLGHVFGSVQSIPTAWVVKYLSRTKADVILRMNERTWKTPFYYYFHRSRERGGLLCRWRKFLNDNELEEHDVCVFEPANIGSKPIMLDVSIFHCSPSSSSSELSKLSPELSAGHSQGSRSHHRYVPAISYVIV